MVGKRITAPTLDWEHEGGTQGFEKGQRLVS